MNISIHQIKRIYQGFINLLSFTCKFERSGHTHTQEIIAVDRQEVVAILPYDPSRDEVVLIDEHRPILALKNHPTLVTGIPAGLCEPHEDKVHSARRELKEETHLEAIELHHIKSYWATPGISTERIHLYIAIVDLSQFKPCNTGQAAEGEHIYCYKMTRADLEQASLSKLDNALTLMATWWLKTNYTQFKARPHL